MIEVSAVSSKHGVDEIRAVAAPTPENKGTIVKAVRFWEPLVVAFADSVMVGGCTVDGQNRRPRRDAGAGNGLPNDQPRRTAEAGD